jgi:uncharacterized membrane protein (DUF4010 family)
MAQDGASVAFLGLAQAVPSLVVALGCGLLIGVERERRKGTGPGRRPAGLRSFALVAVLGAAAMLAGGTWIAATGAAFVAGLGVVAYLRDRSEDPGITTELALFQTYLIGVIAVWSLTLAAAMAVALTALLAAREPMHRFARQWLRPAEVRDGIILAALVLIAMPLVPDRALGLAGVNPQVLLRLLALLLLIQSLAHLCRRLMRAREALALSSVASGFVSSTATIASLGWALREGQGSLRPNAGAAVLSCVATMLQLLVVAVAIQPAWLKGLVGPCLGGALAAGLYGAWLIRGAVGWPRADSASAEDGVAPRAPTPDPADEAMFSLKGATIVALLLTAIQLAVAGLKYWLGDSGLMAAVLLASLVDLHAAMAAVMSQGPPSPMLVWALALGVSVHAVSKGVTAALSGGVAYLGWTLPGLLLHTAVCIAGLMWADGW